MMQAFAANQDRMREQMRETMSGMFPFGGDLQKMSEQNAALFDSAVKMFTPFGPSQQAGGASEAGGAGASSSSASGGAEASEETLQQLKQQVDLLQKQLDVLTRHQRDTGTSGSNGNGAAGGSAGAGKTGGSGSQAGSRSS
jgi:polyhydroxyalkanoate synthesis regulator protein